MPFQAELYPSDWEKKRKERLDQAGYRCEECGVPQHAIQTNTRTGTPYMVYLSLAHKNQYETWKSDAEIRVLCQRCHRRYDRQFRRRAGARRRHTPFVYIAIFIEYQGRETLAGMPHTYDEFDDILAVLPSGSIKLQMAMICQVIGEGCYLKREDGTYHKVEEYGTCVDFIYSFPGIGRTVSR